jgi:hypothetical protein
MALKGVQSKVTSSPRHDHARDLSPLPSPLTVCAGPTSPPSLTLVLSSHSPSLSHFFLKRFRKVLLFFTRSYFNSSLSLRLFYLHAKDNTEEVAKKDQSRGSCFVNNKKGTRFSRVLLPSSHVTFPTCRKSPPFSPTQTTSIHLQFQPRGLRTALGSAYSRRSPYCTIKQLRADIEKFFQQHNTLHHVRPKAPPSGLRGPQCRSR